MKIKVKQTVMKILSEHFQNYGFKYGDTRSASKDWVFSRQMGDITEWVSLQLSNYFEKSIRMRLANTNHIF